ncbi:hypothetical protein ACFFRR_003104 [Megaselia abdita]
MQPSRSNEQDSVRDISNSSWWDLIGGSPARIRAYLKDKNTTETIKSPRKRSKRQSLGLTIHHSNCMSPFNPGVNSTPVRPKFLTIEEQESWEDLRRMDAGQNKVEQILLRKCIVSISPVKIKPTKNVSISEMPRLRYSDSRQSITRKENTKNDLPSPPKYRFLYNPPEMPTRSSSLQPESPPRVELKRRNAKTPKASRYCKYTIERRPSRLSQLMDRPSRYKRRTRLNSLQYASPVRAIIPRNAVTPNGKQISPKETPFIKEETPYICSPYSDNDFLSGIGLIPSQNTQSISSKNIESDSDTIDTLDLETEENQGDSSIVNEEDLILLDNLNCLPLSRAKSKSETNIDNLRIQISPSNKQGQQTQDDLLHRNIMYEISEDIRRMAESAQFRKQEDLSSDIEKISFGKKIPLRPSKECTKIENRLQSLDGNTKKTHIHQIDTHLSSIQAIDDYMTCVDGVTSYVKEKKNIKDRPKKTRKLYSKEKAESSLTNESNNSSNEKDSPIKSILSQGHRKSLRKSVQFSPIIQYRTIRPVYPDLRIKIRKLSIDDLSKFEITQENPKESKKQSKRKSSAKSEEYPPKFIKRELRPRKKEQKASQSKETMESSPILGSPKERISPIFDSPPKSLKKRTPIEDEKEDSPEKSMVYNSPPKSLKKRTPIEDEKEDSPEKSPIFDSPPKSLKKRTPIEDEKEDSPEKGMVYNSPPKSLKKSTAIEDEKEDSKGKSPVFNSPTKSAKKGPTIEVEREDFPEKSPVFNSPPKSAKKGPTIEVQREDSPEKSPVFNSPPKSAKKGTTIEDEREDSTETPPTSNDNEVLPSNRSVQCSPTFDVQDKPARKSVATRLCFEEDPKEVSSMCPSTESEVSLPDNITKRKNVSKNDHNLKSDNNSKHNNISKAKFSENILKSDNDSIPDNNLNLKTQSKSDNISNIKNPKPSTSKSVTKNPSKIPSTSNVRKNRRTSVTLTSRYPKKTLKYQKKEREMSPIFGSPRKSLNPSSSQPPRKSVSVKAFTPENDVRKSRVSFYHNNDDRMRVDLFEIDDVKYISDGQSTFKLEINQSPLLISLYSTKDDEGPHPDLNLSVGQVINIYYLLGNLTTVICKSEELNGKVMVFGSKDKYNVADKNILYGSDIAPMKQDNENILGTLDNLTFETVDGMFECLWFWRRPWDKIGYIKLYPNGLKKMCRAKFLLVYYILSGSTTITLNKTDFEVEKGESFKINSKDKYSIRNDTNSNCILKIIKFH